MQRDCEMGGIGMLDVKFPKNRLKKSWLYTKTERKKKTQLNRIKKFGCAAAFQKARKILKVFTMKN